MLAVTPSDVGDVVLALVFLAVFAALAGGGLVVGVKLARASFRDRGPAAG